MFSIRRNALALEERRNELNEKLARRERKKNKKKRREEKKQNHCNGLTSSDSGCRQDFIFVCVCVVF